MSTIRFRRLFEVRLLHEFFLQEADGGSFFFPKTDGKTAGQILLDRLVLNKYGLMNDLEAMPTAETQRLLDENRLRFVPHPTGFFVAAQTKLTAEADDSFAPMTSISTDLRLHFLLKIRNSTFLNYTNTPVRTDGLGRLHFFTNRNEAGKTSPSLSQKVDIFESGHPYEMGDLTYNEPGGHYQEALRPTSDGLAANWKNLRAVRFAHQGDRVLLAKSRISTLKLAQKVQNAVVILKDDQGRTLKTIERLAVNLAGAFDTIPLDFTTGNKPTSPAAKETSPAAPAGLHTLEIGAGGVMETRPFFLTDQPDELSGLWGLISIRFDRQGGGFDALTAAGNVPAAHRVFEIRLQARKTFWEFAHPTGKELEPDDNARPFLSARQPRPGVWITRQPQPFSSQPIPFLGEADPTRRTFFPNPPPSRLRPVRTENPTELRLFASVPVGQSIKNLFSIPPPESVFEPPPPEPEPVVVVEPTPTPDA